MIKTVIFDLGGVIVPLDFPRGYQAMSERCGLAPGDIPERIRTTGLVPRYECGEVSDEEFVSGLTGALGFEATREEFRALWSSIFPSHTLIPESLLLEIKKNHRLVLLSNTNGLHFEMILENYPLVRHFDDYVLSYKVGAMKPSPSIYAEAIAKAGCAPGECFYTDDIAAYVEGARQAGIDAVQFLSHEQVVGELRVRGVAV
jgi:glucose-1-phosphatase